MINGGKTAIHSIIEDIGVIGDGECVEEVEQCAVVVAVQLTDGQRIGFCSAGHQQHNDQNTTYDSPLHTHC